MSRANDLAEAALDSSWLDKMVNKLKRELEAQLKRVSEGAPKKGATAKSSSPAERAADARTLAALERTLEKLVQMEQTRALVREAKIHTEGARDALERRLDKLAAGAEQKQDS